MDDVSLTDTELLEQICSLIATPAGWAYPPAADTEVGVFYRVAAESPDLAVSVNLYSATDANYLHERRVQLMHRGREDDAGSADALADTTFARLHGLSRVGGISGIRRTSMAPLGVDGNGRPMRSDNYLITLDNPEAING